MLIWAGSQNVVWLIMKKKGEADTCVMEEMFQFSSTNREMQVRYILPSDIYNGHIIVAGAFDFATAMLQVNTYENRNSQPFYKKGMISQYGKGIELQLENMMQKNIYQFHMVLVPKSSVVVVTTDIFVVQLDYLTFEQKSMFASHGLPINLVAQVNPNSTMVYRYHQNTTSSLSFLWQPYPCLNYN